MGLDLIAEGGVAAHWMIEKSGGLPGPKLVPVILSAGELALAGGVQSKSWCCCRWEAWSVWRLCWRGHSNNPWGPGELRRNPS